jgi:hypothetical protein
MRRIVGIILSIILALLVVIPLGGYFWLRTSLPLTSGTVRVAGLDGSVEIVRDQWACRTSSAAPTMTPSLASAMPTPRIVSGRWR